MHARRGGKDVGVLREHVVGGESDELGATPKHPAKEVEGVECVGEWSRRATTTLFWMTSSTRNILGDPRGRWCMVA